MGRARPLGWTGGYVGLAILAALLTFGVMLLLFTDSQGASPEVDVGDLLGTPCSGNGSDARFDSCYAIVLTNTSEDVASDPVTCTVSDPLHGRAQFVNNEQTYVSAPIPAGGTAMVLLQVRPIDGPTDPPVVRCETGPVSSTA